MFRSFSTRREKENKKKIPIVKASEILVKDVEESSETDYDAIQLDFADQYKSGFLNPEVENKILILFLNKDCSTKFRSMMNSYTNLLLYVNRMESTEDTYLYPSDLTSIHIYYYENDTDNEHLQTPKMYSNFKTKVENLYYATTGDNDYLYPMSHFNENKIIQVN